MTKAMTKRSDFFPFDFPCEVASARGTLKHSHLDNGYIGLPASSLADVIGPNKYMPYQETMKLYEQVLNGLVDGYSPARLVDLLSPFQKMTVEKRNKIKTALQAIYEERFKPEEKKTLLEEAGKVFFAALDRYFDARKSQIKVESDDSTYRALKEAAIRLRDVLETLPKGIWLP